MLVLSRQRNEIIRIGDDIAVCVIDVRGDKVRLGVNAPKETPVHRQEVYDAILRQSGTVHRGQQALELPPIAAREPLSSERMSEIVQMEYQPFDTTKASDYFEAMHDLLGELVRVAQATGQIGVGQTT